MLCLTFIQANRLDFFPDFLFCRLRDLLHGWKTTIQLRKDFIHLLVRALRAQHDRNKQLPVLLMKKSLFLHTVGLIQPVQFFPQMRYFCYFIHFVFLSSSPAPFVISDSQIFM